MASVVSDFERSGESVTGGCLPNLLRATVRDLERGDVLGSRYQIEAEIGSGGSGRVLRAFDRESRMAVALKILRPELAADPVWLERFSRELRVGRSITHPNVCRVFDIGDTDGHKFLSMELASRGSVRADVPKRGSSRVTPTRPVRSWPERAADARAVVAGVAALHAAGIVHRDLKPENILRMEDGRLVVTDFGLATDPGAASGNTVMIGTPSYMAPEVVMGEPATMRSDVWGLGVVLHELLFGCRPQWKALGPGHRRFMPPPDLATAGERAAAVLCGRCADDAAELRPASAVEMSRELERALLGKRGATRSRRTQQLAWGAVALASFVTLGLIRERWSNRAQASLSQAAGPLADRVLKPTGEARDLRSGATTLAALPGRLYCYALIDGAQKVRVIWGTPKRAEDIVLHTGERGPSPLLPETYRDGCPALSPDGKRLLFEKRSETGSHVFVSRTPDGRDAAQLVSGGAPEWLPNGQEFLLEFDGRHAAQYSILTGRLNIIDDGIQGAKQLAEKTVDPTGKRVAVRYFTDTIENLVVVQSLVGLEPEATFKIGGASRSLRFIPDGSGLLVSIDASNGMAEMVRADWKRRQLTPIGRLSGSDLDGYFDTPSGTLLVSKKVLRDLWLQSNDGTELRRLTNDGYSDAGSLSESGDLLVQRQLADGRSVVLMTRGGGSQTQVTNGSMDTGPTFGPDGRNWFYASYSSREIFECGTQSFECRPILADPLTPMAPIPSPSGRFLAYLTFMNIPRIHVLDRTTRATKDLGPIGDTCPPLWTSDTRVWIVRSGGGQRVWSELNVSSQEPTGASRSIDTDSATPCEPPPDLKAARRYDVVVRVENSGEVLLYGAPTSR